MNEQEFIKIKITETQEALDDAAKYLLTVQQQPRVKANLERFMQMAQQKLARYACGELNEGELYRLEIENSA